MIDNETKERALAWANAVEGKAVEQEEDNVVLSGARDYTAAIKIAVKLLKKYEGLELRCYPDPASDLSKELSKHGILRAYIDGKLELPPYLAKLSGAPLTIGYGDTENVKQGDVITQEEAERRLSVQVGKRLQQVLKAAPSLSKASDEAIAACLSLQYNVGQDGFAGSTCVKRVEKGDMAGAAEALTWFNKANGAVNQGLVNRRNLEKALFLSVRA